MQVHRIVTPAEFSFELACSFLERSPRELLHRLDDGKVYKALRVENKKILIAITHEKSELLIQFLNHNPSASEKDYVTGYVNEWLDLATDLKPFYIMVEEDKLLGPLVKKFYGYRIVGQPDLFESLVWAVMGQQINLTFAYTLKQRFVEQFGEAIEHEGQKYFLFPTQEVVSQLTPESLLALQFSKQKANYTIGIAQAFASGEITKESLQHLSLQEGKEKLMKIKGIGNWTANYALMKTFRYPDAFPLEDVGIHNAIKNLKGMKSKPTLDQVKRIFKKYKGWEAYATLYLWKSL
jgi:DNA-3-methyladenine glycosylase II